MKDKGSGDLMNLDLDRNDFTDVGCKLLATNLLENTVIKTLNLGQSQCTEITAKILLKGMKTFNKLGQLTKLYLKGSMIKPNLMDELENIISYNTFTCNDYNEEVV